MALPAPSPQSTAVVTGASAGIGEQFARRLAARGHHVTLVARRRDRLEQLAAELGGEERAAVLPANLAAEASRDALVEEVEKGGRDVEVLVNNAGFAIEGPFAGNDRHREIEQVRVLVEAVVDLTHRWLPGMVERRRGAVVTMASASGFTPAPGAAGYAAAKAHAVAFSEAVHAEVAEHGVTVTVSCPGPVATDLHELNDIRFTSKVPQALWVTADQVVDDTLAAVAAGKRTVVPGGRAVKAAFAPSRYAPVGLSLAVGKKLTS